MASANTNSAYTSQNVPLSVGQVIDNLPITSARGTLVKELKNNPTLVVIGETGSGKTTQVPKYILEAGFNKKKLIAVSQPRRLAAISMATRVADELGEQVGETVGYCVRFEEKVSEKTKIKFMTDGMLLREGLQDANYSKYSYIVIDEAHERTLNTDLLMGLLKSAQAKRAKNGLTKRSLHLVIMSATMDADKIGVYFDNSKVVFLEGRSNKIIVRFCAKFQDDYCYSSLVMIYKLHDERPTDHHILVFLTGQNEIESLLHTLRTDLKSSYYATKPPLEVLPLYAALSNEEQMKVFNPPPAGTRRVILSTNIAETSVTIPGLKIVIDCGYIKKRFHNFGISCNSLAIVKLSKAQASQRAGRAGREGDGECYRLYTKQFYETMDNNTIPEIQRVRLSATILHLLKIGIKNPFTFEWIDPPTPIGIVSTVEELSELKAIDVRKRVFDDLSELNYVTKITELGAKMASIPLEPEFSLILLTSSEFNVVEQVVSILSIMSSSDNVFQSTASQAAISQSMAKFSEPEGDLVMYLKMLREFKKCKNKTRLKWCVLHSLNYRALSFALQVREQLLKLCQHHKLNTTISLSWEETKVNVRKCFHKCMGNNIAVLEKGRGNNYVLIMKDRQPVKIHPSSSLCNKGCSTVLFTEVTRVSNGTCFVKHISVLDSKWL